MQIVSFLAGCDMGFWVLHKSRPSCGMGFWLGYRGSGCRRDQGGGEEGSCLADDMKPPPPSLCFVEPNKNPLPLLLWPKPTTYYVLRSTSCVLHITDYRLCSPCNLLVAAFY